METSFKGRRGSPGGRGGEDQTDGLHRQDRSGLATSMSNWRRQKSRPEEFRESITLEDLGYENAGLAQSNSSVSLGAELGDVAFTDEFQEEVARTSSSLLIGRQEAETEVFTNMLIRKHGDVDKALLYVVANKDIEAKILVLINNLIHRGADTSAADGDMKTPLHFAAQKNWKGVAAKLLDNNASAHKRDKAGILPLHIAIDNRYDDMCALLLAYMPNYFVRNLFIAQGSDPAELSFHTLIRSEMQKTILSVLDCLIEVQGSSDHIRVYYNVLECDEEGNVPRTKGFDSHQKSPLQIIAKQGYKNIVYHDAVRLLVRRKWKEFARSKFQVNSAIYMVTLLFLTFSVIVAVMTDDPAVYDSPLQIVRGVAEVLCLINVLITLLLELNQLRRHRLEYFTDAFNWFDMSSSILLLMVPAFRFTGTNAQWHVYAFGFLCWVIRIFKFAAVFRQTGAYAQILGRVIVNDFVQFGIVFFVVLLAFSGSFFLSLRGDQDLDTHNETSTFWGILVVGVRTLSEAQPVVEYAGEEGYSVISAMFMVLFLFACCVILLNILIAQLSDTYQKVQQDAQRGLEVNRAWIVARVELNSFYFKNMLQDFRTTRYEEYEDIPDLREVLTKWESPPLNEMNKYVRDIWESLDNHKMNLLTIQHRMARQENAMRKMQDQLSLLVSILHPGDEPGGDSTTIPSSRPTFYRSHSDLAASASAKIKAYKERQLGSSLTEKRVSKPSDVKVVITKPGRTNADIERTLEAAVLDTARSVDSVILEEREESAAPDNQDSYDDSSQSVINKYDGID